MSIKRFIKVATLRFSGPRFDDNALDLSAIPDLAQFQKLVRATAEAMWRDRNPDRSNLPRGFSDEIRLCVREILPGSAILEIETVVEEDEQQSLIPHTYLVAEATALAYEGCAAIARNEPPPETLPRCLVPEIAAFGSSLADGSSIDFSIPDKPAAAINSQVRERWNQHVQKPYTEPVELVGEVYLADLKARRFGLWIGNDEESRSTVVITLSENQEDQVLAALRDHHSVRLSVSGLGEKSPEGKLLKITEVKALAILTLDKRMNEPTTDFDALELLFGEFQASVTKEDLHRLPPDLAGNIDKYLSSHDP